MYGLEKLNIINVKNVYRNFPVPKLVEEAIKRGEGVLANNGAFNVYTGKYTGRSPNDKFIVDEPEVHEDIWWENNKAISMDKFERLYNRLTAYLQNRDIFIFDGFVGADLQYRIPIRVITEYAYQSLLARQLFIRPNEEELRNHIPEYTLIAAPKFNSIPELDNVNSEAFIILSFTKKLIIIGGSQYGGEIKKSIFTLMNYLMPKRGVLSMHCSANIGKDGDTALFFGLSGTGKTTLSADPQRFLIGDDEHGWSDKGIFNFEGGCYAKCINLSKEKEPQIWNAIKFGTVLENVVYDENTRELDYSSDKITENTRAAYSIDFIPGAIPSGMGGHPKAIIFLTADAFGVLPPIAKLTKEQAMYYFLSGYTSKLAGTERGITEPQATFSTCFGAPFLPLKPMIYAKMLGEKIEKHNAKVYLVNTGWSGGPYGIGNRINLAYTRAMVTAALNGSLDDVEFVKDPIFNLNIPTSCPGVPSEILNPKNTWTDKEAYEKAAKNLALRFAENFKKYKDVTEEIKKSGPNV
ncbi:phosphoenolpyruvate carboxykinase (ATP) [Thermoanaerobacter thermohydrosulfuricus]|uniref:Phosphoenolpyruvate carboxykinase (ATP) n=2 Tax=Thermoanaerobacter thermohydrosulfuricus TaxID=1516 RepID=M8CQ65_THETY|nr:MULTISPECIES: phosphoenolpyruvate carboxykinase (ATP) [Thermoanaerobacter]EGD51003.1 phosphoenolpyruvate carboxykinase (ATP) [Thermoanaerobacter ethanolicus JW 200]EMT39280.1 phosphoenolpyruvate carboxykinase (ATP) [Thermoanaerobacter thermohydrosulfuricus WC1]UZQ82194.1 phosphoenolpyruvate carboxykinase (ATP) [Thermoanaerobacter sp. RKWS2]SDG24269.1 phosphoenolpyruvate carboxykinase (ATP) [Thermoanaerobacter thermohydrosulfuricus]